MDGVKMVCRDLSGLHQKFGGTVCCGRIEEAKPETSQGEPFFPGHRSAVPGFVWPATAAGGEGCETGAGGRIGAGRWCRGPAALPSRIVPGGFRLCPRRELNHVRHGASFVCIWQQSTAGGGGASASRTAFAWPPWRGYADRPMTRTWRPS